MRHATFLQNTQISYTVRHATFLQNTQFSYTKWDTLHFYRTHSSRILSDTRYISCRGEIQFCSLEDFKQHPLVLVKARWRPRYYKVGTDKGKGTVEHAVLLLQIATPCSNIHSLRPPAFVTTVTQIWRRKSACWIGNGVGEQKYSNCYSDHQIPQ